VGRPLRTAVIDLPESRALLAKTGRLLVSSKRLLKYLNDRDCEPDSPDRLAVEAPSIEVADRFGTISHLEEDQERPPPILVRLEDLEAASAVWNRPRNPR
jgi:hypothetical protein